MGEAKDTPNRWHPGELAMQDRAGVRDAVAASIRSIRSFMPEQHRAFFPLLPFIVLGTVDDAGDVWAGLRFGEPGFAQAPDPHLLALEGRGAPDDPAEAGIRPGASIGLLGIELHTRRRNRLNGRIRRSDERLEVEVVESFGNCPKYIQARIAEGALRPLGTDAPEWLEALDDAARAAIEAADTLFVASFIDDVGGRRVDVSHRGGRPGFVRVEPDGALTIPDFVGNDYFMTLGNFQLQPRAGLCFPDFETGAMLQLTGTARTLSPDELAPGLFPGAQRYWRFQPRRMVRRHGATRLAMRFVDWSQATLGTGDWMDAARRAARARLGAGWRSFRVTHLIEECDGIRSIHLEPEDGLGIIPPLAGQHLPIRLTLPGDDRPTLRTYSISSAPEAQHYRLSIKRAGRFSGHMHAIGAPGTRIEAKPPSGQFTIDATAARPAVLLAGGIGVTPLLAMAHHLVSWRRRTRRMRPTWLFQAARRRQDLAFQSEIAALVLESAGVLRHVRVLSDPTGAEQGRDYDIAGRIEIALLKRSLPWDDYDFVLCGPPAFMQAIYDGLRAMSVRNARIHAEAFGPASLVRQADADSVEPSLPPAARDAVPVRFAAADREALWTPEAGSLLDLAEAIGLAPPFSCRGGSCGSCRTALIAGEATYATTPNYRTQPGEILLCQAKPAAGTDTMTIDT